MRIFSGRAAATRVKRIAGRGAQFDRVDAAVKRIVQDVRRQGDRALRRYARTLGWAEEGRNLRHRGSELQAGVEIRDAGRCGRRSEMAAANIRSFCERQKPARMAARAGWGLRSGQLVRPLDSVGCYVPGGSHPLMSTVLMAVIPAQVAGVKNIRIVSPRPAPEVLAAAGMLGVREFYRVGGAQAIAALAYGTESVPGVDKIVGPGNLYVTAAKKLVSFDCAIDFLAGPTEVVIVSDGGRPEFIARDLVAQAEHDPEALSVFITTSKDLAAKVDGQR